MAYTIEREINDGIERITYIPQERRFQTPIVFQHGAWHGAWCWKWWQELFAEWGWLSHAHSLPAHGASTHRRNIRFCTMNLYRDTLMQEMDRCERTPIVIGHSMGGAIAQWMMNQRDDLPGVVLLASMPLRDNVLRYFHMDLPAMLQSMLLLHGKPLVDSPEKAAALFLSDGALMTPQELHAALDAESLLISQQHMLWNPQKPKNVPVLVVSAEDDAIFSIAEQERLASFYSADWQRIPNTAHNIMMERSYREAAQGIHDWLVQQGLD